MELHALPTRIAGAAENMALDFLLLQRYPQAESVRFRHYEWQRPAFTFGFGQKFAWVRGELPPEERLDLCRRPTGGGIVDHRTDWTYALVIPRAHAWWDARASESYHTVHACLAQALRELGQPATVKERAEPADPVGAPGVCFERAELYDVVHESSGKKIAGAAQKRNKHGLLFQGSIWKPAVDARVDWDAFGGRFIVGLAEALGVPVAPTPWPDLNEDEVSGLIEQYASPEWLEYR